MRLLNLELKNFMAHANTYIDFTQLGSPVLIKGINLDRGSEKHSNEAGKSTLFKGIDYCLFTKRKHRLRRGATEGKASLTFEHNGHIYNIIKEFTNSDYKPSLYKDGQLISQQKTEVERYMYDLLGIDRKLYEYTIYQSQHFSDAFGNAPKQVKTDFIMSLMEIKQWETYHQVAKNLTKLIIDYGSKSKQQKEILEMQLVSIQEALSKSDIEQLQQQISLKQSMLKEKQQLLEANKQTELLLNKKEEIIKKIKTLTESLENANKTLIDNNAQLQKYKPILEDLIKHKITPIDENYKKNLLGSFLSAEKTVAAKQQEMKMVEDQIREAEKKKPLVLQQNICPFCRRVMDDSYKSELEKHLNGEIASMNNTYQKLGEEYNNLIAIRSNLAKQVDEMNKQIAIYNENIRTQTELEGKINQLESINQLLTKQCEKEQQELAFNKKQLEDTEKLLQGSNPDQLKELYASIDILKTEIEDLQRNIMKIENMQANILTIKDQIAQLDSEIQQYAKAQSLTTHSANILSINGIQKALISEALEEITILANSYLARLGKSVFFQFEKSKKSSEGTIPVFETMVVNQYKEVCELDELSGAEFVLVNFALRLALTTLVANKYNFQYLIVDEGIKDLDEPYREFVASMLKSISGQFQIFLITHFPDFAYEFNNSLLVKKENGVSSVVVLN